MDGVGLVYQGEEELIDRGSNVLPLPRFASPLIGGFFPSLPFLKGILLGFAGPAAKTLGINKESGA